MSLDEVDQRRCIETDRGAALGVDHPTKSVPAAGTRPHLGWSKFLVHPVRNGRGDPAREYRDILLRSLALTALPLSEEISEEAARLRARHGVKTPDAIQLATAKMAFRGGDVAQS